MDDMVSRKAVNDALEKIAELYPWKIPGNRDTYDRYNEAWQDAVFRMETEIEQLPSAQPQRTGRWWHYEGHLTCSECETEYYDDIIEYCGDDVPRFCPHCGARMEDNNESD